jgi:hypothetical protein
MTIRNQNHCKFNIFLIPLFHPSYSMAVGPSTYNADEISKSRQTERPTSQSLISLSIHCPCMQCSIRPIPCSSLVRSFPRCSKKCLPVQCIAQSWCWRELTQSSDNIHQSWHSSSHPMEGEGLRSAMLTVITPRPSVCFSLRFVTCMTRPNDRHACNLRSMQRHIRRSRLGFHTIVT